MSTYRFCGGVDLDGVDNTRYGAVCATVIVLLYRELYLRGIAISTTESISFLPPFIPPGESHEVFSDASSSLVSMCNDGTNYPAFVGSHRKLEFSNRSAFSTF